VFNQDTRFVPTGSLQQVGTAFFLPLVVSSMTAMFLKALRS